MSRLLDRLRSPLAASALVFAAYALLAVVVSFPLVLQFADHIPGVDGDVWSYLWAMGTARTSLALGINPFHNDYVFYPLGGATQLLWGTALPSFASLPFQLAFGLVPAFNLTYLLASALTGLGFYLLALEVMSPLSIQHGVRGAAFLAGVIFTFGALRLGYGLAFTNLFHTEFIPFYVLFLLRATRLTGKQSARWRDALLAGFFFALNVYIDFQIAAFLVVLSVLWFAYVFGRVWWSRRLASTPADRRTTARQAVLGLVQRGVVLGITALALSLPLLGMLLYDFSIEGGDYIRVYPLKYSAERSYDLVSYFLPNARSTLYSALPGPKVEGVNASVTTEGESELSPDRQPFLGIAVLILALIGAVRFRRAMLFWILAALIFGVLSLGPVLHVLGNATAIPLPFVLVNNIPILNHIRIPMRYGLMVSFSVALLAGAGALVLCQSWRYAWLPLIALVLIEAFVLPYPTLDFSVPDVYSQIAQEPGDFSIVEIPSFNWRYAAKNEAYQTAHGKRILRGYTNRIAPEIADYFNLRQTPIVVRSLRILEGAEKGKLTNNEIAQDRAALNDTLTFFNLRYALVHRDQLTDKQGTDIDAYLRNVLGAQVFYNAQNVIGYRLPTPAPETKPLALDLADNSSLMYLGRGWQIEPLMQVDGTRGRALQGAQAEIYLPFSPNTGGADLFAYSPSADNPLALSVNGLPGATIGLDRGWKTYALQALLSLKLNRLAFQAAGAQGTDKPVIGTLETH